mgnify:CR=1 FL=1
MIAPNNIETVADGTQPAHGAAPPLGRVLLQDDLAGVHLRLQHDPPLEPDGQGALQLAYGPGSGGSNLSRFKLEAFDTLYRRIDQLPDGPERMAAFRDAKKLMVAYMPYKFNVHRLYTDLTQPWVIGYRRPTFWRNQWHRMDVDMAMRRER